MIYADVTLPAAAPGSSPISPSSVSPGSQRVLAAMGPGMPWLTLSQIKQRVRHTSGDFIPSVESALKELQAANKVVLMEQHGKMIQASRTQP